MEEYVRTNPPDQVYDAVLLPALKSVKRDRGRGALSEDDARFIVSRTREIVEELGSPPAEWMADRVRVLGCPARDELDELALLMFRQLARAAGVEVEVVSTTLFASEAVALARETGPALVCIATVPPGGLAHARYLVKRVRVARPDARILVGRWGKNGTREEVRPLLLAAGADEVAMSLTEARDHVLRWLPCSSPPRRSARRPGRPENVGGVSEAQGRGVRRRRRIPPRVVPGRSPGPRLPARVRARPGLRVIGRVSEDPPDAPPWSAGKAGARSGKNHRRR